MCIDPLFVSFHVATYVYPEYGRDPQDWLLSRESLDYLRRFEPIGCRDLRTLELLERRDVECYFSGCLTLTFEPVGQVKERKEGDSPC